VGQQGKKKKREVMQQRDASEEKGKYDA